MKKFWLSFMAVALISTTANAALFQSEARKERGFSCTDMCTGDISKKVTDKKFMVKKAPVTNLCEAIKHCEDNCLKPGSLWTRAKGKIMGKRADKVELALMDATETPEGQKCQAPAASDSDAKTGKKPPFGGVKLHGY